MSLEPALHQSKADTISLWATRTHVGYGKWDCDKPPGPISEFSCFLIRLGCIGPFLELYKRCLVVTLGYFVRSFRWRCRFAHSCISHGWVAVCTHKNGNCGSGGTRIARLTPPMSSGGVFTPGRLGFAFIIAFLGNSNLGGQGTPSCRRTWLG